MAGELRTRSNRLREFSDVSEVEAVLECLERHKKAPLVQKLPRQPGKRDCRYVHLFNADVSSPAPYIFRLLSSSPPNTPAPCGIDFQLCDHFEGYLNAALSVFGDVGIVPVRVLKSRSGWMAVGAVCAPGSISIIRTSVPS